MADASEFNRPVWYGDQVIPSGFTKVLDDIDGLQQNWDTNTQIDVLIKLLRSRKRSRREK